MLTGRRTFERANDSVASTPGYSRFVVTHRVPDGWPRLSSTVQFVTNGIEGAVLRAKRLPTRIHRSARRPNDPAVPGRRLLDENHIDLAAVLLGTGVRLFDHLAKTPAVLGNPRVVTGIGGSHLRFPCTRSRPRSSMMRKLIATVFNYSLDGLLADEGTEF